MSATDEEVEAAVARVKAQYNLTTDAEFDASLAQSGMTRDELKRQMRADDHAPEGHRARRHLEAATCPTTRCASSTSGSKEQFYAIPESAHVAEIVLQVLAQRTPRRGSRRSPRSRRSASRSRPGRPSPISRRSPRRASRARQGRRPRRRQQGRARRGPRRGDLRDAGRRSTRRRRCCPTRSTSSTSPIARPPGFKPFSGGQGRPAQADLRRPVREALHRVHGQAAPRRLREDLRAGAGEAGREEGVS